MRVLCCILTLIMLCSCNVAKMTSEESNEIQQSSLNAVQEESVISEKDGLIQDAFRYLEQGNYLLIIGSRSNDVSKNQGAEQYQITCRLIIQGQSFDSTIVLRCDPADLFTYSVFETYMPFEIQINESEMQASLTVEKRTCSLDFLNGTYEFSDHYREKDLVDDNLLAVNAVESLSVYKTYIYSAGDTYRGDYIVLDTQAREIWQLSTFNGFDQVLFCGLDKILICHITSIDLLDAYTGTSLANTPNFMYTTSEGSYYTIGACYDEQQDITLIAYRDSTDISADRWNEASYEIFVSVFNNKGEEINKIETGFYICPWYGIMPNPVIIEVLESGRASLSSYNSNQDNTMIELGTIAY